MSLRQFYVKYVCMYVTAIYPSFRGLLFPSPKAAREHLGWEMGTANVAVAGEGRHQLAWFEANHERRTVVLGSGWCEHGPRQAFGVVTA